MILGPASDQEHEGSILLGGKKISFISNRRIPGRNDILPATELMAHYATLPPAGIVLQFGSNNGVLSAFLARQLARGRISVTDSNFTALTLTHKTISANHLSNVEIITDVDLPRSLYKHYDVALIQIPKGRQLIRRWLLQAHLALLPGGCLYIAGSNDMGIQSAIKDATELYGSGQILAYKKSNRICRLVKQSGDIPKPDWASSPGIAPGTWIEFDIHMLDNHFRIRSLPGVFSHDHLDAGTEMLLQNIKIPPGAKVLDVGCGYGMIGMFAAAQDAGWVDLVDNDLLAVAACKETLSLNHITNATVFTGDLLNPVAANHYDLILSNPPFHTAHDVDYRVTETIIRQSYQSLVPGGQLVVVANRFIPYDRLISGTFGRVTQLAESGRFHVLSGLK